MSDAIDDYLRRLRRELQQRRLSEPRLIEEAREHLLDAVTDGRERGLSLEDAEREALERFGPPETVALDAEAQEHVMHRIFAACDTVWQRKWWILVPTLATAVLTSVLSSYFLPTRYRSESVVGIRPPRIPEAYVRSTEGENVAARLASLRQQALSRTRLERVIRELGLYGVEHDGMASDELVQQMRRDISLEYFVPERAEEYGMGAVRVSFVSSDPNAAAKVTERLSISMVEENRQDRESRAESINTFVQSQIADVRQRLLAYTETLEELRATSGDRPLSPAHLLPYEVLQQRYKELLLKGEEARTAVGLERRQIGEQLWILEGPRVPDDPVGPSRFSVNVAGMFAGLGLGFVLMRWRSRPNDTDA